MKKIIFILLFFVMPAYTFAANYGHTGVNGRQRRYSARSEFRGRTILQNSPHSANAIAELRRELNGSLAASSVQSVVRQLSSKGLISSEGRGVYRNEDPELLAWVSQQELP